MDTRSHPACTDRELIGLVRFCTAIEQHLLPYTGNTVDHYLHMRIFRSCEMDAAGIAQRVRVNAVFESRSRLRPAGVSRYEGGSLSAGQLLCHGFAGRQILIY